MDGINYNFDKNIRKYTEIGYFNEARQNQKNDETETEKNLQQEKAKSQEQNERTM